MFMSVAVSFVLFMLFSILASAGAMLFVPLCAIAFCIWIYSAAIWVFGFIFAKTPTWLCWLIAVVLILALVL